MDLNHELTFRMGEHRKKTRIERQNPDFAIEVRTFINDSLPIHNKEEYRRFISGITDIISRHRFQLAIPNTLFDKEIGPIADDELNINVANWGGVSYQRVDVKRGIREKYLLVRQSVKPSGTLWLEHHEKKDEHLYFKTGFALIMTSEPDEWERGEVTVSFAGPGDKFTLHPGNVHGVIALTKLVILEKSDSSRISDILAVFP